MLSTFSLVSSSRSKCLTSDLKDKRKLEEELGQNHFKKDRMKILRKVRNELDVLEAQREGSMNGIE